MKTKLGIFLLWAAMLTLGSVTEATAQAGLIGKAGASNAVTMFQDSATPDQRAIHAVFLASVPSASLDSALSFTNTLAGPPGIQEVFDGAFADLEGTLEFYLWDEFGHMIVYETLPDSPGVGLTMDGTLTPGLTYRVLLSEILAAADYEQHAIDFNHTTDFLGYGWVVANFDGVQGTANVTDFSTFTQATVMQPDVGTTFFDFDANAGVPLIDPPDEPDDPMPPSNN